MLSSCPLSNIFVSENLACGAPVHVTESSTRSIWETALKKPVLITGVVVGVVIKKRWVIRSSENQTDGVGSITLHYKQNTDSAYGSVACDQVKTALSDSQAEAEE